ncbi:unnamed protein product [Linum tenue]
MEPAK